MSDIKVHCIGQERWFIRRQVCKCGSQFDEELQQALTTGPNGPVDGITMRCRDCGAIILFRFDISSCSPHLQPRWTERVEAYAKVMPREEAMQLVVVPMMERVLGFINELQQAGDTLGLEFIGEAVTRARQHHGSRGA